MDTDSVTLRTRKQVDRVVRAVEEARRRAAAARPPHGRPQPQPASLRARNREGGRD
jgi:hypothetical protein